MKCIACDHRFAEARCDFTLDNYILVIGNSTDYVTGGSVVVEPNTEHLLQAPLFQLRRRLVESLICYQKILLYAMVCQQIKRKYFSMLIRCPKLYHHIYI